MRAFVLVVASELVHSLVHTESFIPTPLTVIIENAHITS